LRRRWKQARFVDGKQPDDAKENMNMKHVMIIAAVAASLLTALTAEARPVRPYERWCLNMTEHRGGGIFRCYYATYEQCMASRTANGEWCMLNPELGSEPRGYYYR
jgi:Protein of unknown function (DUF3551)